MVLCQSGVLEKNKGGGGGWKRKREKREAGLKRERPSCVWVLLTLDEREREIVNIRLTVFF